MLLILGLLTWLSLFPLARSKDVDQSVYRRRVWHSIAVFDDRLYIDGGLMSNWVGGKLAKGESDSSAVNKTISISLRRSWKSASVEMEDIEYGDDVRRYGLGVLWASASGELYRWGGKNTQGQSPTSPAPLWILDTKSDSKLWYDTPVDGEYAASIGSAPTTCGGLHLSFGGSIGNETYYKAEKDSAVQGVTEYNETTKKWMGYSNSTIPRPYGTHKMGEAICLEGFTKTPLVLLFGGRNIDPTTMKDEQNDIRYVTLYDPVNHRWYEQKTTGLSEGARDEFCAVGVKSKSGTFEIYAYGGHYGVGGGTQKDVCVLTLPGFHWICPDKLKDGETRLHHTCTVAGKNQMISVGGSTSFYNTNSADPWANTIGVLNLNTWDWSQEFDAGGDEYDSPTEIKNWYANETREQITWSSPELEAMFVQDSSNGTDSNGSDSTDDSKTTIGVGGIVGAAIGGVAFIALVIAALWFLRRRRGYQQQAREIRDEHNEQSEYTGTETETSTQYYGSHYNWGPTELNANEYNKVPQVSTPPGELENPAPQYELDGGCRVEAGP